MKSRITLLLAICSFSLIAQNPWTAIDDNAVINRNSYEREIIPEAYSTYSLDLKMMRKLLSAAPMEDLQNTRMSGVKLDIPQPDGSFTSYEFVESPCMSPVLSAKYPHIKSYRGYAKEDGSTARIDIHRYGFDGALLSPRGKIYIDSYFSDYDGNYISYYTVDHKIDLDEYPKTCGVEEYERELEEGTRLKNSNVKFRKSRSSGVSVIKTTYRLALACTGRWGSQQGGDKDIIMTKMNLAVNRLNQIFEDELAIKFELIDDNDKLAFTLDDSPYTIPDSILGGTILRENTDILNLYVGRNNYDVGHVFTIQCDDVGGVAFGSSVCTGNKGAGVSCLGTRNISNFMAGTTAHELGHQFSAGHTWAGCGSFINNQHASSSACEPGSGVTILSYSGACGTNNLRPEIPLYHSCTLEQMMDYSLEGTGSTCGNKETADNHHPDVWIEQQGGMTIPIATPFELTGEASDMDDDEMSYSWEQIDTWRVPVNIGDQNGPLFRFWTPGPSKTRVFPRMRNVLRGSDWREERMPVISRDLTFRFVARDHNLVAGGVSWADIGFKSSDSAGPFVVTEPSNNVVTEPGKSLTVEWDVANTDNDIVNCQFVDIYMSTDEGETFPHLLVSRTPNDGSTTVNSPNLRTTNGIIKVKGSGSIFFNVGEGRVTINEPSAPTFFVDVQDKSFDICLPENFETEITTEALLGFDEMVNLEIISGLPDNAIAEFSQNPIPVGGSSSLKVDMNNVMDAGIYDIVIQATAEGVDTVWMNLSVSAGSAFLDDFQLMSPTNGTAGITKFPNFEWATTNNAYGYRLEVALNPNFLPSQMIFTKEAGQSSTETGQINLDNSTLYYWRVIAYNDCIGEYPSDIYSFSSIALSCATFEASDLPIAIPSSGKPTVTSKINVESAGTATDINVKLIRGSHTALQTLRGSLISPDGTTAILWQGECTNTPTLNAGFDDESSFPNGCPNVNGRKIQPREPLSIFSGKSIEGDWVMQIEDTQSANGGTLSTFELELCSDQVLDNPYIVNNNVLEVRTGGANFITREKLLCQDDNNTSNELIYTIVKEPSHGTMSLNGETLIVGSQFTQASLTENNIKYKNNSAEDVEDNFVFTLIDGEGGWIEQTLFIINTSDNGPSNTSDELESSDILFEVYPNPTNDAIHIEKIVNDNDIWNYILYSLDGKIVTQSKFNNKASLDLSNETGGVYYLNLNNGTITLHKKILVVD